MNNLLARYKKYYGYNPTIQELYSLYTQGELQLSDSDENALLKAMEGVK